MKPCSFRSRWFLTNTGARLGEAQEDRVGRDIRGKSIFEGENTKNHEALTSGSA